MEDNVMHISPENIEVVYASEYCEDLTEYFGDMPEVARPLMKGAKKAFSKIENMLYSAPAFINLVKASVPEQAFQAILTNDQKAKLASGALKLMTKKDGSLMANLVNPERVMSFPVRATIRDWRLSILSIKALIHLKRYLRSLEKSISRYRQLLICSFLMDRR